MDKPINVVAAERLAKYIDSGRLVRNKWSSGSYSSEEGYEYACLLVAMAPRVGDRGDVDMCPVELMPPWFACLVPWLDDVGSKAAWPGLVRRFAGLAARWHVLESRDWCRLELKLRLIALQEMINGELKADDFEVYKEVARRFIDLYTQALEDPECTIPKVELPLEERSYHPSWIGMAVDEMFGQPPRADMTKEMFAWEAARNYDLRSFAADRMHTKILDALEEEIKRKTT